MATNPSQDPTMKNTARPSDEILSGTPGSGDDVCPRCKGSGGVEGRECACLRIPVCFGHICRAMQFIDKTDFRGEREALTSAASLCFAHAATSCQPKLLEWNDMGTIMTTIPAYPAAAGSLAALAKFERTFILSRTTDGKLVAKARSVAFSRLRKMRLDQQELARELAQGEVNRRRCQDPQRPPGGDLPRHREIEALCNFPVSRATSA